MSGTEQRIECDGRLIARRCERGVKVWCDKHKHEVLLTWEELGVLPVPTVAGPLFPPGTSVTVSNVLY